MELDGVRVGHANVCDQDRIQSGGSHSRLTEEVFDKNEKLCYTWVGGVGGCLPNQADVKP